MNGRPVHSFIHVNSTDLVVALLGHIEMLVNLEAINMLCLANGLPHFGTDMVTYGQFDNMVLQLEALP